MREKAKGVRNCWCRIMLTMVLMLLCMTGAPVHASSSLPTLKIKPSKVSHGIRCSLQSTFHRATIHTRFGFTDPLQRMANIS